MIIEASGTVELSGDWIALAITVKMAVSTITLPPLLIADRLSMAKLFDYQIVH
ncbi:hypothetical protein [Tunicatimonas pelagia]|uniref:hypothetical protein n=1 Tax=Tunicatimonas pelagia TaxID=931531 RepID=UPI0026665E91|nr:hypothetical protein [Tunicatimonas pelagia]WKN42722.1 hypothetical protein P0M28_27165 [Tunicatimonas pelagia]